MGIMIKEFQIKVDKPNEYKIKNHKGVSCGVVENTVPQACGRTGRLPASLRDALAK